MLLVVEVIGKERKAILIEKLMHADAQDSARDLYSDHRGKVARIQCGDSKMYCSCKVVADGACFRWRTPTPILPKRFCWSYLQPSVFDP